MSKARPPKLRDAAPERPREPTRQERADARKARYDAARAAVLAAPDDEELVSAFVTAKRSHEQGLDPGEAERRERRALELLVDGPTDDAVTKFSEEFGVCIQRAYDWISKAIAGRFLGPDAARIVAIRRLEAIAFEARSAGDYASATRATATAAKLGGVKEPATEVRLFGSVRISDGAPDWTRRDDLDPRVSAWIFSQTRVIGDADVIAFEKQLAVEDAARAPVVARTFRATSVHESPPSPITVEGTEVIDVQPPKPPSVAGSLAWLRENGLVLSGASLTSRRDRATPSILELFQGARAERREVHEGQARAAFATWLALRGDAELVIQARLGQDDSATTQRYIAAAEELGKGRVAGAGSVHANHPRESASKEKRPRLGSGAGIRRL